MNKRILIIGALIVALTLLVGPFGMAGARPAMDLDEDIETSIQAGLTWLVANQQVDGGWGWGGSCDRVARTGLAVLKFETYAYEQDPPEKPLDPGYIYYDQVNDGLTYLMGNVQTDAAGTYFDNNCWPGHHTIYNTGIAMMALASSGDDLTYGLTLQQTLNWMVDAQVDAGCGLHQGGWGYDANTCGWTDNSNAGYATLGIGFAQAPPPYGFGLLVPQATKDELSLWIDAIQHANGGSSYMPGDSNTNILKTGNLLYEMALAGDTTDTQRVKDAVAYIQDNWHAAGGFHWAVGWEYDTQAMFTMMKGFEGLGIRTINFGGDPEYDWFAEVAQFLVDYQNPDGSWSGGPWSDDFMGTAWALLTLERSVPPIHIPVAVDIHPGSCPNPLNVDKKGVTPAAIAGTDDFDVYMIDPASILLKFTEDDAGVPPLRWSYEDAAWPYEPYVGKEPYRDNCLEYYEGDGFMDLTLKFGTQEIAAELLGGAADGDVLVLHLTGFLKEEFGGTPIVGEDVVWIIEK